MSLTSHMSERDKDLVVAAWIQARSAESVDSARERDGRLRGDLFQRQLAVVDETCKRIGIVTSRRSGKTELLAHLALLVANALSDPTALVVYISLTRDHAKTIFWPILKRIDSRLGLGFRFNEAELVATSPTGGRLRLYGADKAPEIEKVLGSKIAVGMIDEAQSFPGFLRTLIVEKIQPALADLNGTLIMAGTPNAACAGFFFDVTQHPREGGRVERDGWAIHHWTIRENEKFPGGRQAVERYLGEVRELNGWGDDDPTFQRDYLGRWVRTTESLVYAFDPERNLYTGALPRDSGGMPWQYGLAIDLGASRDRTAFAVGAYSPTHQDAYCVRAWGEHTATIFEDAGRLSALIDEYRPAFIKMDEGALGKKAAEELRQRYNIPVTPADKQRKRAYIELMNADLRRGVFKAHALDAADWAEEVRILQWAHDREGRRLEVEDPSYKNDVADAVLYLWRELHNYVYREKPTTPQPGTPEWDQHEALDMRRRAIANAKTRQQRNGRWWTGRV